MIKQFLLQLFGLYLIYVFFMSIANATATNYIEFKAGCRYALSSIGLDTDYEWLSGHCEHVTQAYYLNTHKSEPEMIKAIKLYNAKQYYRKYELVPIKPLKQKEKLNDALINTKKTFRA